MVVPAVNEDLVKGMVDLLVSSGLKKAGYNYFVIDGNTTRPMHDIIVTKNSPVLFYTYQLDLLRCCHHADAWSNINRDEDGRISANSQRFSSGSLR